MKTAQFLASLLLCLTLISCDWVKKWFGASPKTNSEENSSDQQAQPEAVSSMSNQEFLSQNKNKEGVQETASGLQYKALKKGAGKSPTAQSEVEVHYQGTLIDGTEFDSSYKRNKTARFPLNGVIPGWTEGLQLMKEGAVYEFYIPSRLAYGDRNLPNIPAGSTLIFKVELIKVF